MSISLKTEQKTIGDVDLQTTQFPAMRAFSLLARLAKVIGPALGALSGVDPSSDLSAAGPALAEALAGVQPKEASELVLEILESTMVTSGGRVYPLNKRENIDTVFSGKLMVMLQAVAWVIGVNFADFLGASAPSASPSPAQPAR